MTIPDCVANVADMKLHEVEFDTESRAAYMLFKRAVIDHSVMEEHGVVTSVVDFDREGEVVGVEFINV